MKLKIVSVVLAAALAFAMAPAHADEGEEDGQGHEENGQGHIKYDEGTLKGRGLGHGKHHDVSPS